MIFTLNRFKQVVILLIFGLLYFQLQAQVVKVIDNKGTIIDVHNNQVTTTTTAPETPIDGDIWIHSTTRISKIWDTDDMDWKEMNTWLGYKTVSHNTDAVLKITHIDHNNADIHLENTGELSINATDVNDATTFYITNTTNVDRVLSFTGFTGAYLRKGQIATDIKEIGLTLLANSRYLANISDKAGAIYFNTTTSNINNKIRPTIPISDNFVFKGYTAHKSTGLPQNQGWAGAQLGNIAYFQVLQDGTYDIGGVDIANQPYLNLRDRGNLNAQMVLPLNIDEIDTALSTNGGFTFSFYGRVNTTANNNSTLSLLLEWIDNIVFSDNTSRIWMILYKTDVGQFLGTNGAANDIKVANLDEYIGILLSVNTDGSAEVYLNGVKEPNLGSVLNNTRGRNNQFTLESGSGTGLGEEANIIQYGGYFATTEITPNKITLTNATGLDSNDISIDYQPNAIDRELEFELDNAPTGATITINPRHKTNVVKLTRTNDNITFNGYKQFTKVSSIPFVITHLGDNRWVL